MTTLLNRCYVFAFLGSKSLDHSRQFENHQLGLVRNLFEKNIIFCRHVVMLVYWPTQIDADTKAHTESKIEKIKAAAAEYGFELELVCVKGKTFGSLFSALKQIKKVIEPFSKKLIFCQNYYSGYIGLRLKQSLADVYLHINFRGLPAEEELLYSDSLFLRRIFVYFILKLMGRKIIPGSDSLSVVSDQYKTYLEDKYKSGVKSIIVYPCAYDAGRFYPDQSLRRKYREKYKIKNHQKVFIYSGSMHKYQMPLDLFRFYENISKQDREKNCVFIVLTPDRGKAEQLSRSFSISNLRIRFESGRDLTGAYNAGDIGVICRRKDIVNRVASPTKIAEYLATGNSVILTDGIGDYSGDLKDKKFAIVKKDLSAFLQTPISELMGLSRPNQNDLAWIRSRYSDEKISLFSQVFV